MSGYKPNAANFHDALEAASYGKFQWRLFLICSLCLLAAGCQSGLTAYVIPAAQCELGLRPSHIGYINCAFILGATLSASLWGRLADKMGRRSVLMVVLLFDAATTWSFSRSMSLTAMLIFRFLNGFFTGAPSALTFTYIAEFLNEPRRSRWTCLVGMSFTAAWLILPALAWCIIPLPPQKLVDGTTFSSWRFYILLVSLPSLLAGCFLMTLPESPEYLMANGYNSSALKVLQKIFKENTGLPEESFPIKVILSAAKKKNTASRCGLFRFDFLGITVGISGMMFCNMFGYFGLGMWIPELLQEFHHPTDLSTAPNICGISKRASPSSLLPQQCDSSFDVALFQDTVIIGIASLVTNIIAGFWAHKFNRITLPTCLMFLGSTSAILFYWIDTKTKALIAGCIFQLSMSTANVLMTNSAVDVFPTEVAATGVSFASMIGRIGGLVSNVLLSMLFEVNCAHAIGLVAVVIAAGGILCLFLNKMAERAESSLESNDNGEIFRISGTTNSTSISSLPSIIENIYDLKYFYCHSQEQIIFE